MKQPCSKRKLIIIALLLLAGTSAWAQRDFRKGYIITNQQDTIYGWIDYRGDVRNAKICSFKKTETDPATDYTPSDIAAYRFIDSKFYISRNIGDVDTPKQVFLEYVVNGLANLYYYRENNAPDRYYIEKDGQFRELKIDKKEVKVDEKKQINAGIARTKTVKSYIGVLKATLNLWEMNSEIDKAKLQHSSLINIARNYHQYACTDGSECIVYERKKPYIALRIGPAVGVDLSTFTMLEFDHERYAYHQEKTVIFDPSTNYTVGVNLNFSMPRLNEKIFLQMQTMYTKYYFFKAYEIPQRVTTDLHIRSNVLQMGLAVKYEYPKGKWRPTLAVGAASIWLPDGSLKEITDKYYDEVIRPSTMIEDFPTKLLLGFEVIPGIHYYLSPKRIIFLQAQYLQTFNRLSINIPVKKIRSFGITTGIYF